MKLDSKIEAVLFFKGEPITIKKLSEILGEKEERIEDALKVLEENLKDRGLKIISNAGKVMLGTDPEASGIISEMSKEELERDLGKAGLETLSTILYKGPISKKEIDYIRGVNSSYILRNLLVRGLIEKVESKVRSTSYQATLELLSYLNVTKIEELPEYEQVKKEIEALEKANSEKNLGDSDE